MIHANWEVFKFLVDSTLTYTGVVFGVYSDLCTILRVYSTMYTPSIHSVRLYVAQYSGVVTCRNSISFKYSMLNNEF